MTNSKDMRVSGKVFHKHKYITNPDVTPEDRVMAAMSKLSQEISGRACNNHLSNTTLEQLTHCGYNSVLWCDFRICDVLVFVK